MSVRPIDMQISIAAMNQTNHAHSQVNQAAANAHDNVARIQKDQQASKEQVKDLKDSNKVKSVKDNDEDKDKQKKKNLNSQNKENEKDKDKDDEELEKQEQEKKKKKNFIYRLGYNGKLELRPEDVEGENQGEGHIDLKA